MFPKNIPPFQCFCTNYGEADLLISISEFGVTENNDSVKLFRITNKSGAYIEVLEYGASLHGIIVPDKNGIMGDVLCGVAINCAFYKQPVCRKGETFNSRIVYRMSTVDS
jgi:hypothetical protein